MKGIFFFSLPILIILLLGGQLDYALSAPKNVIVDEVTPSGQHLPSIALGPDSQTYIVWVDCRNDPTCETNTDIYFARSTDGGQSFDPAVLVSDDEASFANSPKIATDSIGNIYVVWHDNRTGDSWDVYLRKSENGGETFSPSVQVNDYIPGVDQYEPDLALDSSGNIYVSWNRYYSYVVEGDLELWDYDVYMAKSTDGGATFGTHVKVNDGSDWQYKSSIKVGPSGNVYVTWTDRRNGGISDVYFAKSIDGGSTFSTNARINQYTEQSQGYPEMALDEDEVIYVVWNDSRNLYKKNGRDVFMARSLDLGDSFEPEIKINDAKIPAAFEYFYPTITAWGKGHVAIAWEDKREGTYDVYLTRSDNGGSSFRPSWRLNSAEKGSQSVPDIVMDGMGHVHCTWRDERSGDFVIYFALDESVKSVVKLLSPNGGEVFSTDEPVTIEWDALAQAVSFDLYYSVDEGSTWKVIIADHAGSPYPWTLPPFNGNKKQSLVKVVGFDSEGKQVAADKSDKPFTIQVVKVTYPSDLGITFTSGDEKTIQWEVYPTKSSVETVEIYLTKDGGSTWTLLNRLPGNYRSIDWTPEVGKERKQCKVKVVLKDIKGNNVGVDSSDNYFTIEPP
jgi:hypothetical protein